MGPREGTVRAAALAARTARGPIRRARLSRFPLRVTHARLDAALSGDPVAILRGPVKAAMPTVARWESELARIPPAARERLLAQADEAARHRFDLLGSGRVELGRRIDWAADFKTGRRWPMQHISRLPIVLGGGSDIKVPWELSRAQHLPLIAAAHRLTGERRWLDEIGAQLEQWTEDNPVEFGPNWACTMDVAIRAANWTAALAMVAEAAAPEPWFRRGLASLLLHGRFIRSHLEWAEVRGNHYLSDIVGLLMLAALFGGGAEGRAWAQFATGELLGELTHQVRADGCDHEASIPYHRLVAELFVCGFQAIEAMVPERLHAEHRARLDRMLAFTADYTRPDGLAPQVGDADDGRFLPLGGYGDDPRDHRHLFEQAGRPFNPGRASAAYPDGGYWVMRAGQLYVLVRCGDVGLGSHAHNDALSFELAAGRLPLVTDPGSYVYTADPVERNRFRSTAYHSTLAVDGAEQNPLRTDALFAMEDVRHAEVLAWDPDPVHPSFTGRQHGFERLAVPATHTRTLTLDGAAGALVIRDTVSSSGPHDLSWTFPLQPCDATATGSVVRARFAGGAELEIEAAGVGLSIEAGWISPGYGRREPAPFVRARKRSHAGEDVTELVLRARPPGRV